MIDKEVLTLEELAIGMAELQLSGSIEYEDPASERFGFTDKGWDAAWDLWFKFSAKERILLFLLMEYIRDRAEVIKTEDKE